MRMRLLCAALAALLSTHALGFDATKATRYPSPDLYQPNADDVILRSSRALGGAPASVADVIGATAVVRSTVSTRKIPYSAMRLVGGLAAGDPSAGALYVRQSIVSTGLNPVTDAAGTVFNYVPDSRGLSLAAMGCVDDGANAASPTDNYASCILPAINYLDGKGGGNLLIDGFFATSQAVPWRSGVCLIPAKPETSGFIAHPTSTDNVLGEGTPPSAKLPIVKPCIGAGLVIDGNKTNVAYNTRGPGGVSDDAYQNCVRLYQVQGLEAPSLTVRNCTFNGYSDYFYGQDNHVGRLIARNIGKAGTLPTGARSYNAAWIEFDTTRSTIDYLDVDGARERGYYLTTGYATAYPDATQFSPAVLGGRIRNTQGDGMGAEIAGGDYGEIRDLRILDVVIDMTGAPAGTQGLRLASPSTSGNNVISNPQVRVNVKNAPQHGILAYGNVTTPRFSGSSMNNGGLGLGVLAGVSDAVVENFVALGNGSANLQDQATRTRIGLGVVTDQATAQTLTRALGLVTAQYPQMTISSGGGDVGLQILRDGVAAYTFEIDTSGVLNLYKGGNVVDHWPK